MENQNKEFSAVELIIEAIEKVGNESAYELADNFANTLEAEKEKEIMQNDEPYKFAKMFGGFKGSTTIAIMVLLQEIEKLKSS